MIENGAHFCFHYPTFFKKRMKAAFRSLDSQTQVDSGAGGQMRLQKYLEGHIEKVKKTFNFQPNIFKKM
jgi:hypothetical protein